MSRARTISEKVISRRSLLEMAKISINKLKILIFTICIYMIILPANISGELSKYQYEIIELAFTNGFLKGMRIDDDVINELLKDNESLNNFVRKAAREYMDKVVELNWTDLEKERKEKENSKEMENSSGKTNNSIAF